MSMQEHSGAQVMHSGAQVMCSGAPAWLGRSYHPSMSTHRHLVPYLKTQHLTWHFESSTWLHQFHQSNQPSPPCPNYPNTGQCTWVYPQGYFLAFSLFGTQGTEIPWLIGKFDQIGNSLNHIWTCTKKYEICAPLWKLCKCCQIWNCQVNGGEIRISISGTRYFPDLGACLAHFSTNLLPNWVLILWSWWSEDRASICM